MHIMHHMREVSLAIVVLFAAAALAAFLMFTPPNRTPPPAAIGPAPADVEAMFAAVDDDDSAGAASVLAQSPAVISAKGWENGETPLHHATTVSMARQLITAGADIAARDSGYGATPARWARSRWRADVADFLDQVEPVDEDIAYLVAAGREAEVRQALLNQPEALDTQTSYDVFGEGLHLLHIAATLGQTEVVTLLLEAGADVNVAGGDEGTQPLSRAAWAGFPDTVKALIARGADLNAEDRSGRTALWYAAVTGRQDIVRILLDAGAKVTPGLSDAARSSAQKPYPGRALPDQPSYLRVAAMIDEH